MGKSRLIITDDGSHTLFNTEIGENYHSSFGAIQESKHIFIGAGLKYVSSLNDINILEIGTGTGLNVLLSYIEMKGADAKINYDGVELFPIDYETIKNLNFSKLLGVDNNVMRKIHSVSNEKILLTRKFSFTNFHADIEDFKLAVNRYNLVYFDAFSPDVQPEMWSAKVFEKLYESMMKGGVLTTYSCKGIVKRALTSVGFEIEKLPGPPGKREFLRAFKI